MTSPTRNLSVLVVDDNRDGADSLAQVLGAYGHEVRTAYSPREAGRVVRDGFRPDAVIMDIGLPDMDGFAVGRELCAALLVRPLLVAVTGHADLEERSRHEGFEHHFMKPVEPDALAAILDA